MQTDPPAGVSASPIADNVMTWYDWPMSPARDTSPSPQYGCRGELEAVSQHCS
jgi:hypothetical protein